MEACEIRVMDSRLREDILQLHAHICAGLADPSRIMILYTLAEGPCNVTELAAALDLPQPTVSRHLKILRDRGMVSAERKAQAVEYSLVDHRLIEALDILRAFLAASLASRAELVRRINGKAL